MKNDQHEVKEQYAHPRFFCQWFFTSTSWMTTQWTNTCLSHIALYFPQHNLLQANKTPVSNKHSQIIWLPGLEPWSFSRFFQPISHANVHTQIRLVQPQAQIITHPTFLP